VSESTGRASREGALAGEEVAITGRLASMTRAEARERIEAAGACYAASPGPDTRFLFVGQDGPPLGEDGRLTRALREARRLQREGRPLEILGEEELLGRLGMAERCEDLHRLYTTAQLARILSVPPRRVRSWVRQGLLEPVRTVRRLEFFEFSQVTAARRLGLLTREGASPLRVRRSLEQLSRWFPEALRSLPLVEALERGGPLLVRTPEGRLAEPSGQLRLDFEAEAEAATEPPVAGQGEDPGVLFARGVNAEEDERLEQAAALYRQALDTGSELPEVAFNLGNVLYALGRWREAARHFLQATELDEQYVEAWNNLGNALIELGHLAEAMAAFRRALAIEPTYADAHFNLAEALASQGELALARSHWSAYLELDPLSDWAIEVRRRLARTAEPE